VLISDVLRTKGYNVVRIHPTDSVELAVRKLAVMVPTRSA
jgi:hypothetical protein